MNPILARRSISWIGLSAGLLLMSLWHSGAGQPYDRPDSAEPGDKMIQDYLRQESGKIEEHFLEGIHSAQQWQQIRPRFRQEYFEMLGLWPLPEKTDLHPVITRHLDRGEYVVDMLQYQSRPGLYVTGNLYRPRDIGPGERLPAILYVCGHSYCGRNGNKTAYQSHGIWLACHGYICLMMDTLQLGEIAGIHHGTYREGRWWWLSRGYTPAGVECWNGLRGIDYLVSRPDVDPERIGVTGISGGGAATFWISAADERVRVAVPVSGLSDLLSYVPDRVVDGHCDCMFFYNVYQWPWARIPALIAPRPLLFVNSDQDAIFPMDGNERVINRLKRVYSLFGASDRVNCVVSMGGHAYRQDIRQAAFRFLNIYLKNDPRPIADSEVDLVTGNPPTYPIPPEQLRVFPSDSDLPADALNGSIDRTFVPLAKAELPTAGAFDSWKQLQLARLREMTFHHFPDRLPSAEPVETNSAGTQVLQTESPVRVVLKAVRPPGGHARAIWLLATDHPQPDTSWLTQLAGEQDALFVCEPRGLGDTRWTRKNPPNYVERAHYLLGRTVDSGRVWDLAAVARYLKAQGSGQLPVYLAGEGAAGVLCAYAALLEGDIAGVALFHPPASHMDDSAPALLNVLRVCDIAQAVGLVAPRPVWVFGAPAEWQNEPSRIFQLAGAQDKFVEK